MLRIEVSEEGRAALPAIDLDDAVIVIGSEPDARVRLPAGTPGARVDGNRWRTAVASGEIGDGVTLELGAYRVKLSPSPPGAVAASPQRTESLARELIRAMLGTNAAPTLEIVRGPLAGARRMLAPPESTLVIGRGDEAGWIIADEELSRVHAEVRRGWDGMRVVDLGSKHGTKLDGAAVGASGAALRDGALLELGALAIRFRDPAEQHLGGPARVAEAPVASPPAAGAVARASTLPFYAAIAILLVAVAALVWLIGS